MFLNPGRNTQDSLIPKIIDMENPKVLRHHHYITLHYITLPRRLVLVLLADRPVGSVGQASRQHSLQ